MKFLRFLSMIILLTIIPGTVAFALPQACKVGLSDALNRYAGFEYSQVTGIWTVEPNEALALREYAVAAAKSSREFCFLLPSLAGDASGLLFPKFTIYYFNSSKRISPVSLCIWVDNMLYDFSVTAETETFGTKNLEKVTVYLDAKTSSIIEKLASADTFTVRLCGNYSYEYRFTRGIDDKTDEKLVSGSRAVLKAFEAMLDLAGLKSYLLWDLNRAASGSDASKYIVTTLSDVELDEHVFSNANGLVSIGDKGTNVESFQTQLQEKGFTLFAPNGVFDEATRKAVITAQCYLGFPQTGNITPDFMDALVNNKSRFVEEEQQFADESFNLGGLSLALNRYWFAKKVTTQKNTGLQSYRTPTNSDNCFLIIDGTITNTQNNEMQLSSGLEIALLYNDGLISKMTMLCESNGGTTLDFKIIPFEKTRILIFCEVATNLIRENPKFTVQIESLEQNYSVELAQDY